MDGWFDDPFFRRGSGEDDFDKHFRQMHNRMNQMMDNMFRGFGDFGSSFGLGFDDMPSMGALRDDRHKPTRSRRVEEVEETFPSGHRHRAPEEAPTRRRQPIVEEPDDEPVHHDRHHSGGRSEKPQTYFYSSSMSSFTGPGGVTQCRKKVYDSSTGKTEMAEMRAMGDKAIAMHREIDRNGAITDTFDRRNVEDDELDAFVRRWGKKTGMALKDGKSGSHHGRALK